ncbi:GH25 family lysozyme M1 (1,4-beta-N-acetylmuramidase)/uncharacterized protein YaeQ [Catenulispora sp. GP43]|uniref:GH25 family lysozyme n=1 Tax=Catenulispora sp. GP43 TaxID=3156263 RepID=UPI00351215AD
MPISLRRTAGLLAGVVVAVVTAGLAAPPASAVDFVPPGYSVTGIDVSSYQGAVDWTQVAAHGEKFAYVKVTEGSTYVNPYGADGLHNAKASGLYTGAYAWPRPDAGVGSAVAQADFFMDNAQYVNDGRTLPPMIDLEPGQQGQPTCYGLSQSDMSAFLHAFVNEVRARAGRDPVLYTGLPFWGPCTGGDTSFGHLPLDYPNYNANPTPLPAGWSNFAFWQYTDQETGIPGVSSATVDRDVFNGSLADLAAFCGGGPKPHPYPSGRTVSGRDADGRLEAFAGGPDGVWHAWQTAVNGSWSDWVNVAGPANAQLAIAPNADGRLELFAVNGSELDHIWQNAPNSNWSAWAKLGGGGYRIAAGANADGRLEVFASSSAGVFHTWQTAPNSPFSSWEGLGGPANSRLQMERAADGRLEVFALSDTTFGHIWQTTVNGGWSAWETFGGGGTELTVNHDADGRLEVFASNASGVFHKWETSPTTWSDWAGTNGGATTSELTSAIATDGRVEVFAINGSTATHIWQTAVNGAWSAWETFGGGGTSITAANNQDGREEIFATSSAGVYHKWQTSFSAWSAWAWLSSTAGPSMP